MRLMERGERNEPGQFSDDLSVDEYRSLIECAAMHDAMPRRDQTVLREVISDPVQQRCKRIFVGCALIEILIEERRPGAVFGGEMYPVPQARAFAFTEEVLARRPLLAREQRELDAR